MKRAKILNVEDLANMLDITSATLRNIISGETLNPNYETCSKPANFFCNSIKQLKCEDDLKSDQIEIIHREIPVLILENAANWLKTKNDEYVRYYKKMIIMNSVDTLAVEVTDVSYLFEYEKGDILIFRKSNEIFKTEKIIGKINGKIDFFKVYHEENKVFYRYIGTAAKSFINLSEIQILGKLIEVKVS